MDGQPVHLDRRPGKLIEQVTQGPRIPVAGDLQGERLVVARRRADRARRRVQVPRAGEMQPDVATGDAALEFRGAALGDDAAVVEDRDPAGELIGLLQVLRGEEDRDATRNQVADDLPHGPAAARIEPGGRLVEEDQPRLADQGHREVEPAPHAAGVEGRRFPRVRGQVEAVQQRRGPPPALATAQVVQVRHQQHVLRAGQQVVHRRELAGDADRGTDRIGLGREVMPGDADLPAVRRDQGGQDLHGGRFAGAVRAEHGEDRSLGHGQVDAVEHRRAPERLSAGRSRRSPARSRRGRSSFLRSGTDGDAGVRGAPARRITMSP